MFSSSKAVAQRQYLEFVLDGVEDGKNGEYYRSVDQRILGSEEFAQEVEKRSEKPVRMPTKLPSLVTVALEVSGASGVRVSDLRGRGASRVQARARRLFVLIAREVGHRNRAVAEYLGRDRDHDLEVGYGKLGQPLSFLSETFKPVYGRYLT